MMKLAIVENDKKFIKIVEDKIRELGYDDVSAYSESQTYKDDLLKNHCQFDIVIMDIELDNDSGIDLTIETNRVLPFCQIIYLTSYIQYVSDVYETDHIYYINKVDFDKYFSKAINKAVTNIHKKQSEILSISWNKIKKDIRQSDILYIERNKRVTLIYTSKDMILKTSMSIEKIHQLLNQDFVRSHESYLINMNYISVIHKQEVILNNNKKIPISRKYNRDVKIKYNRFLIK